MQIARGLQGFFSSQIIAILAAILFPVFARAREKARQSSCLSNCKQIALAVLQYAQDYDEKLPMNYNDDRTNAKWWHWYEQIQPYMKNAQLLVCPSNNLTASYAANNWVMTGSHGTCNNALGDISMPAETIMMFDTHPYRAGAWCAYVQEYGGTTPDDCYGRPWVTHRQCGNTAHRAEGHNGGFNSAECDGHAKWFKDSEAGYYVSYAKYWRKVR